MSSFDCNECGTAIIDSDYGYVTACVHWPRENVTTTVSNKPYLTNELALQSPTPEQELPDLVGEMVENYKELIKHTGYYVNEIDAARAYNKSAETHYGEYARNNEIPN